MIVWKIDGAAQAKVIDHARKLLGVHEVPDNSNRGPMVHQIQESTGAFGLPWCVSFAQYVWFKSFGKYFANRSASVYYCASWAQLNAYTIPQPVVACLVAYHIGDGHMGIVVSIRPDGTFDAIEGNEANAVRWMVRDPRQIPCTFIMPPELRAKDQGVVVNVAK